MCNKNAVNLKIAWFSRIQQSDDQTLVPPWLGSLSSSKTASGYH